MAGYLLDPRALPVNHDFFYEINNEKKAYWLGMLLADGNVSKTNIVSLGLIDKEHIQKFKEDVESGHKIWHDKRGTSDRWGISFRSTKMCKDLSKYSVVPAKSRKVSVPKLRNQYRRHFWRGVFDGDGYIGKRANGMWRISLTGNLDIVLGFENFAKEHSKTKATSCFTGDVWRYEIGGRLMPLGVLEAMYEKAKVYLDRKMSLYLEAESR